jgi:hypothetical protein
MTHLVPIPPQHLGGDGLERVTAPIAASEKQAFH